MSVGISKAPPATAVAPSPADRRPRRTRRRRPPRGLKTFEFAMMAPALTLLSVLSWIPFVILVAMSFAKVRTLGGVSLTFTGLDNWTAVLGDPAVWASWWRSLIYFVSIVALEMLLGLGAALVLHRLLRGRSLVLSIVLLPMFLAPVMVGLLGRFMLDSTIGLYAQLLQAAGLDADLLASPATALPVVASIDVWQWTPLVALILLAGLSSVPPSTLEAATVDGAGYFRTLVSITLPQMRPIILVALLVRSMDAIRYFDIVTATTNGGPADATKIIPLKLYEYAFRFNNQLGKAAVLGLTMLAFSIVLARLFLRFFGERTAGPTQGGDA
ncbi:carbohydrate ABC transporter permease [Pseudosporangium ferrugineum]|uniref:Carbohydrate ABC transporter membrane protein 1 (CUT1 family) n=1 Tax=Pseudosporangium ferrugineum TaxID=439699 RepID=A0A2T0SHH8_9ACTN|nr:sugar ABC transporter permease [Pseudosporangium ferrugineum]PRY32866.1 carbohydrate ABC transporter membrane protein 1 (CUT1 family) [Pseudosporangium ferrugineum]